MLGNQKLINVRKENRLSMYFGTVVYNFACLIRLSYLFYFISFHSIGDIFKGTRPFTSNDWIFSRFVPKRRKIFIFKF